VPVSSCDTSTLAATSRPWPPDLPTSSPHRPAGWIVGATRYGRPYVNICGACAVERGGRAGARAG
jgi:hypothetical protein